ncbi:MAG: hypothetical protein U5L96_12860 [Owenweeksia sp.]|nr:hypothetical protein [Owenweeksia sp.]
MDAFVAGPENRAIIVQVDSTNGDTVGTQVLPKYPNTNSMGTYHDMEILPDGSIVLAYRDNAGGTGAPGDVGHLYKINTNGNTTWEFENDGTNATYQYFHEIYWDGSSLVCTGMEVAGSNNYIGEWVVTRLDTAGQLEWTTTLTGPNTGWGYRWLTMGNTITQNSQGEYLVGGAFKYDNPKLPLEGAVVRFSATGDSLNSFRLAESRGINHIIPSGQGDFMATGTGLFIDSSGGFKEYFDKALLARISASGQIQAYKLAGDTNYYPGAFGQGTAAYVRESSITGFW